MRKLVGWIMAAFVAVAWLALVAGFVVSAAVVVLDVNHRRHEDTSAITSEAFVGFAAIAGLALAYGSALDPVREERKRRGILRGGDTSLFGAALFLAASVLKHAALAYEKLPGPWTPAADATWGALAWFSTIGFSAGTGFGLGGVGLALWAVFPIPGMSDDGGGIS